MENQGQNTKIQTKEVRKWGNSGGILLPREWVGKQVKIQLIDHQGEIKKDVLKILEPWLEEIIGVYLVGSYARNEQTKESDIDILVVSKNVKKVFGSGKYEIEMMPLKSLISLLRIFPASIYPKIIDAKAIINSGLLEEIKEKVKITRGSMKPYVEDCKRKLKINKKLIKDDEKTGTYLKSYSVLYSLILRLRAFYFMNSILKGKGHTNESFKNYLASEIGVGKEKIEEIYSTYRLVARDKKVEYKIQLDLIKSMLNVLEKEVNEWDDKKKKEA